MEALKDRGEDSQRTPPATLALGIVGCGRVVERYHLPALERSSDWKLTAACDPLPERRCWLRGHFPRLSLFESFSALLGQSRPDAVLVATPPPTHCELVNQALEAGFHVLVEKPMALTSADAYSMWLTSLKAQRCLEVGFSRRFRRCYTELKERLDAENQNVRAIEFALSSEPSRWDSVSRFLGVDRQGGGVLDDLACHQLDLLTWLVPQSVRRIRGREQSAKDGRFVRVDYEVEFVNGLRAACSVRHGGKKSDTLEIRLGDHRLVTHGDAVFATGYSSKLWEAGYALFEYFDTSFRKRRRDESPVTWSREQWNSFAAAVRTHKRPLQNAAARNAVETVRAVEACRASVLSGGMWVSL